MSVMFLLLWGLIQEIYVYNKKSKLLYNYLCAWARYRLKFTETNLYPMNNL